MDSSIDSAILSGRNLKRSLKLGLVSDSDYFWSQSSWPSFGLYRPISPLFIQGVCDYRGIVADGYWPTCCGHQIKLSLFVPQKHKKGPGIEWDFCCWLSCAVCGNQTVHHKSVPLAVTAWRAGNVSLFELSMFFTGEGFISGEAHCFDYDCGEHHETGSRIGTL